MSDTEKILGMLAAMNQRMDTMQEDLTSLRGEMAMKGDLQQAKSEMMALMEAYFEPKFDLLADQIKKLYSQALNVVWPSLSPPELRQFPLKSVRIPAGNFLVWRRNPLPSQHFPLMNTASKLVQEKQIPVEAQERTEDRLDVLEAVVKSHSAEIRKLKKAQ